MVSVRTSQTAIYSVSSIFQDKRLYFISIFLLCIFAFLSLIAGLSYSWKILRLLVYQLLAVWKSFASCFMQPWIGSTQKIYEINSSPNTAHCHFTYGSLFSCPGRIFSYCVRARAYTHVLARVYSTRASTCTIYTCFTLPHTRVNLTGLQLWGFQRARSFEIVEIVGIAVSVFVIIGWVGQIQYQKPRSK